MAEQEFETAKIDKGDIVRIHKLLQPLTTDVAAIKATLRAVLHRTPCTNLDRHLANHEAQKRDWKKAVISGTVDLAKMGLVAALTYFIILANGGS